MKSGLKESRFYGLVTGLLAFAMGCAMVVLLLGTVEAALRVKAHFRNASADDLKVSDRGRYTDINTPLGFRPCPNVTIHERAARGDHPIYEVDYSIDDHSRRVTPCDSPETRDHVAAFFGCSFTFGNGVRDNETLPARFAAHCPGYLPVNFAYTAYGPQQMWLQLNKLEVLKALPAKRGAVIYAFIDHHLGRLVGSPDVMVLWGCSMPWLRWEGGKMEWAGTFQDRYLAQPFWMRWSEGLHLLKFLENRMPLRRDAVASGDAATLLVRLLQECADSIAKSSPDLKFCFMLYPGTPQACCEDLRARLKGCKGITLLDYSRLLVDSRVPTAELWYDDCASTAWGHPRALTCDMVAQKLAGDIGDCR